MSAQQKLVSEVDVRRAGDRKREMEIVTWVLEGSLVHQDSEGNSGLIYPGLAQRMSAGTGMMHSEKNDSWQLGGGEPHDQALHFVQMWVPPDIRAIEPGYEQLDINDELGSVDAGSGDLVVVASGMEAHRESRAISIRQQCAALYAARLQPAAQVNLPVAPFVHLFVARGSVIVEATGTLGTGDAARTTLSDGRRVTAGPDGAEILVWQMAAQLGARPPNWGHAGIASSSHPRI